jgi:hypothetical protein
MDMRLVSEKSTRSIIKTDTKLLLSVNTEPVFEDLLRKNRAGIFKQSMGGWNWNLVGVGLSYRPARLNRLAEFIPWNRFLVSLKV